MENLIDFQALADYFTSARFLFSALAVLLAVGAWLTMKKFIVRRVKLAVAEKRITGRKQTYINISVNIIKYLLVISVIIFVLQENGVNVTSIVAGLGIASAIAGLAMQDVLKDLIMGGNILAEDFFVVGDVVQYGSTVGKVVSFTVRATKIADVNNGNIVTVSNRNISEIIKVSDWVDLVVPAPYSISAERMRAVMAEVCERVKALPRVSECSFLGTDEFAESAVNYRLRLYCPPAEKPPMRRLALGIVQDIYAEKGIDVPFRQLDVHSKN